MATSIVYQGDEQLAKAYLPQAQNLLYKVKSFAKLAGVPTYSSTLNLDVSAYCTCLTTTSGDYITIFCAPEGNMTWSYSVSAEMPNFLSGVVTGGGVTQATDSTGKMISYFNSFKANASCYQRENAKAKDASLAGFPNGYAPNSRLVVPVSNKLMGFASLPATNSVMQALALQVSMYSGRMQKLVQVLLGYGITTGSTSGLQVLFDYSFARCHGLYRGPDGTDWIIQIGLSGVLAMQLYLYEGSKVLANSVYADIAAAAQEFNGIPTGQGFPSGAALTSAIANGTVLQLASSQDLAAFYACTSYSSACGWTFSDAGDVARNTAYKYDGSFQKGVHYAITIQIGALVPNRKAGTPVAQGSAVVSLVSEGYLYNSSITTPPCFKLYEPMIGGLQSHPFQQIGGSTAVSCDTVIYVFYNSGQLSTISYFYDNSTTPANATVVDPDPCKFVGTWVDTSSSGTQYQPTMFYSTEVDDRQSVPSSYASTTTVGEDLGWGPPMVTDNLENIQLCSMQKPKYFRSTITSTSTTGRQLGSGIIIPGGSREAYLYAFVDTVATAATSVSVNYSTLYSPYWYQGYRSVWSPTTYKCYDQFIRKVTGEGYSPTGCNLSFANDGSWSGLCKVMTPNAVQPQYTPYSMSLPASTTLQSRCLLFTGSALGRRTMEPVTAGDFNGLWMAASPGLADGTIQQFNVNYSSPLGAFQIVYDAGLNAPSSTRTANGSLMSDFDHTQSYNFIGVP